MRIGIDIDDVITDTSGSMKKYIDKYDSTSDVHKYIEDVMRGDSPTQEIKDFFKDNSINIFADAKVKENASEVIAELINRGDEVFIITTRGEIRFKGSEKLTLDYLKANNIKYTKLLFNSFEKAEVCKEYGIDVMIDDSVKYCQDTKKENIRSILFTSVVNKSIDTNVERANSWLEIKGKLKI